MTEEAIEKPTTFIEGLVYLGKVKSVELLECNVPGYMRVLAETVDGEKYVTRCLLEEAARRLAGVWSIYIRRGWKAVED